MLKTQAGIISAWVSLHGKTLDQGWATSLVGRPNLPKQFHHGPDLKKIFRGL